MNRRFAVLPVLMPALLLAPLCSTLGCSDDAAATDEQAAEAPADTETGDEQQPTYTWWRDVEPIVADKCMGCHVAGDVAPFALSTYEEVVMFAPILAPSIEAGTMPPWPPAQGCNEYEHSRALDDDQRERLLTWIDEGTPEGDPADAGAPPEAPPEFVPDALIEMAEAYTPTQAPDEYRCFVIDGPSLSATRYVTGLEVYPGERQIVHHVIAYVIDPDRVAEFEGYDDAEPGPGYSCFGGPSGSDAAGTSMTRWLGAWVPGSSPWAAPAGSGIRIAPDSKIVVQMHYHSSPGAELADRTTIGLSLADEVERPGTIMPFTNPQWVLGSTPMTIPAGEASVIHTYTATREHQFVSFVLSEINASPTETLLISSAGLHMHTLGRAAQVAVTRTGADDACLLRIDDYDFGWQGSYRLHDPVSFGPGDSLSLRCEWDNSPANQPVINGQINEPIDVGWGEGTLDEMCLGILYVSR